MVVTNELSCCNIDGDGGRGRRGEKGNGIGAIPTLTNYIMAICGNIVKPYILQQGQNGYIIL